MIDIELTTQEAIALEHALSFLVDGLPQDLKVRQEILDGLQKSSFSLRTAQEKLKTDLDNLAQVQQQLLQQPEPRTDLTSREIIALCRQQGVQVSEFLGVPKLTREEAITSYRNGDITEGRLAECLGVDRLEARRIVQQEECES